MFQNQVLFFEFYKIVKLKLVDNVDLKRKSNNTNQNQIMRAKKENETNFTKTKRKS